MSHQEKLGKGLITGISFFFGIGVLCSTLLLGHALPHIARLALANAKSIVELAMAAGVIAVVLLLGKPVSILLSRVGR